MTKNLTIFYSWQSDTSAGVNRSFIERALREALRRLNSDATLEPALRDQTLELDKDTTGVPGSPPIIETILRKIETCTVFVADLTFVSSSLFELKAARRQPRLVPNPNVLIEYGYALKCHSHSALVGVVNECFGAADPNNLPFDLRHLRWPIRYNLHPNASASEKAAEFEKLTKTLVEALRLILQHRIAPSAARQQFSPQKSGEDVSVFFSQNEMNDVIPPTGTGRSPEDLKVPNEGRAFLRVYPTSTVEPFETELDAEIVAGTGGLRPMGRITGWGKERNLYGAIVYDTPKDNRFTNFVQLFLTKEIWAVDAACLNLKTQRNLYQGIGVVLERGVLPTQYFIDIYTEALHNYLSFAQYTLKLPLPLTIRAGAAGMKGYNISVGNWLAGKFLKDAVEWESEISNYNTAIDDTLAPFFTKVWKSAGVDWSENDKRYLRNAATRFVGK